MSILLRDLRLAVRMLLQSPGFTLTAALTLALSIGANTAIFSLVNTALFGPLPFKDADQLVRIFRQSRDRSETRFFSYRDYQAYRDRNDVLDEMIAYMFAPLSVGTGLHAVRIERGRKRRQEPKWAVLMANLGQFRGCVPSR